MTSYRNVLELIGLTRPHQFTGIFSLVYFFGLLSVQIINIYLDYFGLIYNLLTLQASVTITQSLYWDQYPVFGMLKYMLIWMFLFSMNCYQLFRYNFICMLPFKHIINLIV